MCVLFPLSLGSAFTVYLEGHGDSVSRFIIWITRVTIASAKLDAAIDSQLLLQPFSQLDK